MARTVVNTSVKRYATLGGSPAFCLVTEMGIWLRQGDSVIHMFMSEGEALRKLIEDTVEIAMEQGALEKEHGN